jgi:hypothetical protein
MSSDIGSDLPLPRRGVLSGKSSRTSRRWRLFFVRFVILPLMPQGFLFLSSTSCSKLQAQHGNVEILTATNFHDRFIVFDDEKSYQRFVNHHIGKN